MNAGGKGRPARGSRTGRGSSNAQVLPVHWYRWEWGEKRLEKGRGEASLTGGALYKGTACGRHQAGSAQATGRF